MQVESFLCFTVPSARRRITCLVYLRLHELHVQPAPSGCVLAARLAANHSTETSSGSSTATTGGFVRQKLFLVEQQQQPFYGPLSGTARVSRYQKKHSPTHHPDHHLIFISFFHLARSIASSLLKLSAWQSFCTSLVYLLVWSPPPHIPYISSPNQCLLFTAHAHTITTCFALVSILYNLFLVFLSIPYLELCVLP